MVIKRSQKAISIRYAIIHVQVNTFHGYHSELENMLDSGTTPVDHVCEPIS
jgi:hypothetical protein